MADKYETWFDGMPYMDEPSSLSREELLAAIRHHQDQRRQDLTWFRSEVARAEDHLQQITGRSLELPEEGNIRVRIECVDGLTCMTVVRDAVSGRIIEGVTKIEWGVEGIDEPFATCRLTIEPTGGVDISGVATVSEAAA